MVERLFRGCFILICSALGTIFVLGAAAHAQSLLPENFTVEGRLYDNAGVPLNSSGPVDIELEWLVDNAVSDPTKSCVVFRELHSGINVTSSGPSVGGNFALRMGTGTLIYPASALGMGSLFTPGAYSGNNNDSSTSNCAVTAANGDHRLIRIKVRTAATAPSFDTLLPDTRITAVPSAHVAETAFTLQGKAAADFLLTNTSTKLSQAFVENIFTTANYNALVALLNGTSTQFIPANPTAAVNLGTQRLINVGDPTGAQDAATKNYSDAKLGGKDLDVTTVAAGVGGGRILVWDQALNKWVASNTAAVTFIATGGGLNGGPISSTGTLSVDTGTTANKILQLNSSAQIPAVDGFLISNVNAVKLQARTVAATAPNNGDALAWNTAANQWTPTASNAITALTGDVTATGPGSASATIANNAVTSAKINSTGNAINRLLITDPTTGGTVGYSTCGTFGQVLQWTVTGWLCMDVSAILGSTGVIAGTYGSATSVPNITVDAQGRVTALTNMNITFPVTSVNGKTGTVTLTGSDLSLLSGSVHDAGTAAGEVLLLSVSNQLPALDGSNLTNVNAVKLTGRTIASAAPTSGSVLTWNGNLAQWEGQVPSSAPVASVSFTAPMVNAGTSLNPNISIPQATGSADGYLGQADWAAFNNKAGTGLANIFTVGNQQIVISTITDSGLIIKGASGQTASPFTVKGNTGANLYTTNPSGTPAAGTDIANVTYVNSATASAFKNGGNSFAAAAVLGTNDSNSLTLRTNGADRITVDQLGNVGIGTTTPSQRLDVAGNVNAANGNFSGKVTADHLQVGAGAAAVCDHTLSNGGKMRYNPATGNMEYCNHIAGLWIALLTPDILPDPFSFTDQNFPPTNTLITSNMVSLTGFQGPLTANVSGDGSPEICNVSTGCIWGTSVTVNQWDSIQIRTTSAASASVTELVTVTVGTGTTTWLVGPDNTPNPIFVPDNPNAGPSSLIYASFWPWGFTVPLTASVSGDGSPQICNITTGCIWSSSVTVNQSDQLQVRTTSSATIGFVNNVLVSVGSVSDSWQVTTVPLDNTPDPFTFTDVIRAPAGTLETSDVVWLWNFNTSLTASVSGAGSPQICNSSNGCVWGSSVTVNPGDSIQVQTTSGAVGSTNNVTVTVGGQSDIWSVTVQTPVNCTTGSPAIGDTCIGGAIYAGTFVDGATVKLMVTPGNCTNSTTPTCDGGTDTVPATYGSNLISTGATSWTNGPANDAILMGYGDTVATHYCENMTYGGYSDWYLPSRNELASVLANANILGGFSGYYLSSTELSSTSYYDQSSFGAPGATYGKTSGGDKVRCIRRY